MPSGTALCSALAVVLLVAAGAALPASAGAPLSRRLYPYQDGCGNDAGPGRLLPTVRGYTRGCSGDVPVPNGGLPAREALSLAGQDTAIRYLSNPGKALVLLDRSRAVTGQVAAESWYYPFADAGLGEVTWDLRLRGITPAGGTVDLGSTTVTATVLPGEEAVSAPYRIVLASAARTAFRQVRLDVVQRGLNVGMSARRLGDDTWVTLPLRAR